MFKSTFLLHGCIFILVKLNPLQGFPSYPGIQEIHRNEQPIDFNTYLDRHLIQNQISQYQNIPISYNDYVQRIYLDNILQSQINSAIDENCDQNGDQIQRYINAADILVPNVVTNYIVVPVQNNPKNKTIYCSNRENKSRIRVDAKSRTKIVKDNQKKKCKCRKRKNTAKNTGEKHILKNKEKCSRAKQNNQNDQNNDLKENSSNQDVKVCRSNKSRNKCQQSDTPKEKENPVDVKWMNDKSANSKCGNNQNTNNSNMNKIEKVSDSIHNEQDLQETGKRVKRIRNKTKKCRKRIKKGDSYNFGRELDDYFNINEDCAELDHRCTRNHKEDNVQKYQQQYYLPSDLYNNISPYLMMFNPQSIDKNGNFPYNFDYLYNIQQFPNQNSNASQKKSKINRRARRRKNQKKGNKNDCDRRKQDSKQSTACEIIMEPSPKLVDVTTFSEPGSTIVAKIDETQNIKKSSQDIPDNYRKGIDIHGDSKVIDPNDYYDWNHKDSSPIYDDFYSEIHSDNFDTNKEYDWNEFQDRHYYFSSEMSEIGRDRRKYDSTDDKLICQQEITKREPFPKIKTENVENKQNEPIRIKVNNKKEKVTVKLKTSSEEIQFKTPPALDFPDFRTEMVNKDNYIPKKIDVYYHTNNKVVNKFMNNKMSSYSNTKRIEPNEKRNKTVDQNNVETVFGHSKVATYSAPPSKAEKRSYISNFDDSDEEDKNPYYSDGKTTIVIAKSLPYPIP